MKIEAPLTSTSANVEPSPASLSSSADSFPSTLAATVAPNRGATSEHKDKDSLKQQDRTNEPVERASTDLTTQMAMIPEVPIPTAGPAIPWTLPDPNAPGVASSAAVGINMIAGEPNGAKANGDRSDRLPASSLSGERLGGSGSQAESKSNLQANPGSLPYQPDLSKQDNSPHSWVVPRDSGSSAIHVGLTATTDGSSQTPDGSAADTSVPAVGALAAQQSDVVAFVPSLNLPAGNDLQTLAPIPSGEISGVTLNAKPAIKGIPSGQTDSPSKGKPFSLDSRGGRSKDFSDTAQAGSTGSVEPAGRTAESPANSNQGMHSSKDSIDAAVIQQTPQSGQAGATNREQPPAQGTLASATARDLGAVTGSTSADMLPGVGSAQLIQSMHHSEMRLGMQSAEFGNISINTSLNHQSLSAQISIDHSELGRALAVHLPAIQEKLGSAYGVQARVEVRDGSSASLQSNSEQQARSDRHSQGGGTAQTTGAVIKGLNAQASAAAMPMGAVASLIDIRI